MSKQIIKYDSSLQQNKDYYIEERFITKVNILALIGTIILSLKSCLVARASIFIIIQAIH